MQRSHVPPEHWGGQHGTLPLYSQGDVSPARPSSSTTLYTKRAIGFPNK